LEAIVKLGKQKVTAITRAESTSEVPSGVEVKKVDYNDQTSLIEALKGHDALVITMAAAAPKEQEVKLIQAAAAAGVTWVLPNEFGLDSSNAELRKDCMFGDHKAANLKIIEQSGKSSWIGIVCGFWYEFSLSGTANCYGFDFPNKEVTFFDDGKTRINTSTWPQVGRAVANLLSLKVLQDDSNDKSPCLSQFREKLVYISSFNINQREMLDSVLRVTGAKEEDWQVNYQNTRERWEAGVADLKKGDRTGFVRALYTRDFYPDGSGDFETKHGLDNEALGLPKEELDEVTKVAISMLGHM
jgi:hypothetical protein